MRVIVWSSLLVLLAGVLVSQTPQGIAEEYSILKSQYSQRMMSVQSREEFQKLMADRQRDLQALLDKHQGAPASDGVELARGRILADLERIPEAEARFAALLARGGDTAVAARFEQVKLRLQQRKTDEALSLFRAIEAKLKPGEDLYNVWLRIAYGSDDSAVSEEFSRKFLAVTGLPAEYENYRPEVMGNLADLMAGRGDRAGARQLLEQAIAAAKQPAQAQRLQRSLRQLQLVGQTASAIAAEAWLNSEPLALEKLKGKVVVIDFWAPWCGPCRQVIPHLSRFHNELQSQGLVVIGFTKLYGRYSDDTGNKGAVKPEEERPLIRGFVERHKIPYPIAIADEDKAFEAYSVSGIPTLVVIGRDGKVAQVKVGSGGEEKLLQTIKKLLAEK